MARYPDRVRETVFLPCLVPGSKIPPGGSLQSIDVGINMIMRMKVRTTMKSERLVVLIAPEEKARIVAAARARQSSVGELVREAVSRMDAGRTASRKDRQGDADVPPASLEVPELPAEQAAALERLAEVALQSMQRANAALDKAFEEVEATKRYFAAKRSKEARRELV
jgi:hypothetical protein